MIRGLTWALLALCVVQAALLCGDCADGVTLEAPTRGDGVNVDGTETDDITEETSVETLALIAHEVRAFQPRPEPPASLEEALVYINELEYAIRRWRTL